MNKVIDLMAALKESLARRHVYVVTDDCGEWWWYVSASEDEARAEHKRCDGEPIESIDRLPDDQELAVGGDVSADDAFEGARWDGERGVLIAPAGSWAKHCGTGCIGSSVY